MKSYGEVLVLRTCENDLTSYNAHGGAGRQITGGIATSGYGGTIVIRWWDAERAVYKLRCGLIGEDCLRPNTPYRLNDKHEFEAVLQKEVAEDRDSEEDDDEQTLVE